MSNTQSGASFRSQVLGTRVERAAALQPQTGQAAIFTISGGKVLVTGLVGQVVVATPATTNTLAVVGNPTAGTDVVWASAVSTASLEVGAIITLGVTSGGALVPKNAGGGNAISGYVGYVGNVGTLDLLTTGSAATGTIKWTLTYVPIDDGAAVAAA
jgi:hypothetical protein